MAYPIVFLPSWILECLLQRVPALAHYTNACLAKNAIAYRAPGDFTIECTPLARIVSICAVSAAGEVVAVVNDATHTCVAVFTRAAVVAFEQTYAQRLTYETVHRLVVLRRADVHAMAARDRADFARAMAGAGRVFDGRALVYLRVSEVEFFSRDEQSVPISADSALRPVYTDAAYVARFGCAAAPPPADDDSDGFVSDTDAVGHAPCSQMLLHSATGSGA